MLADPALLGGGSFVPGMVRSAMGVIMNMQNSITSKDFKSKFKNLILILSMVMSDADWW